MIIKKFLNYFVYIICFVVSLTSYAGFSADTLVQTADGCKCIYEIEVDDKVICWDISARAFVERPVIGKIAYKVSRLVAVQAGDTQI